MPSTINTAIPANAAALSSSAIRGNFSAAANDINTLQTQVGSISGSGLDTVTTGIAAAGTTQATATALTTQFNVVTTVAAGSGVRLPAPTAGAHCLVRNSGANPVSIYPPSGSTINALAANTPITTGIDSTAYFEAGSSTQWYSVP